MSNSLATKRFAKTAALVALACASQLAVAAQCPPIALGQSHPAQAGKDMTTNHTQPWCDAVCVNVLANGTACNNAAGQIVTTEGVCNDPLQVKESILDIEYNLCIDIDNQYLDESGYAGQPPGGNYQIAYEDAALYFAALFAEDTNGNGKIDGAEVDTAKNRGYSLADELNTNGDGVITRNEASQEKGSDPCQLLSTGFNSGLATDDILSYLGLYLGDPSADKYAGDLEDHVMANLLSFTRTWQPSYWKTPGGSTIGTDPGTVTAYYNNQYDSSYRVCDSAYSGKFTDLVAAMGTGSGGNTGGNTGGDTGGDTGGNTGGGYPVSESCPGSHPHYCSSTNQCFTEAQMDAYCN